VREQKSYSITSSRCRTVVAPCMARGQIQPLRLSRIELEVRRLTDTIAVSQEETALSELRPWGLPSSSLSQIRMFNDHWQP
jgi:hypothetical protein